MHYAGSVSVIHFELIARKTRAFIKLHFPNIMTVMLWSQHQICWINKQALMTNVPFG